MDFIIRNGAFSAFRPNLSRSTYSNLLSDSELRKKKLWFKRDQTCPAPCAFTKKNVEKKVAQLLLHHFASILLFFGTVDNRFSDDLFSDNDGFSDQNSDNRISIYVVNTSNLVINIQFSDCLSDDGLYH